MKSWAWRLAAVFFLGWTLLLAGCGGGDGGGGGGGGGGGTTAQAPAIGSQPASSALAEGNAATFSVAATGTDPFTYQWQRDGVDIAGASAASYMIPSVALADSGAQFRVVIRNAAGTATSSAATLTVTRADLAPAIVSQPVGITVTPGTAATLRVVADGTAPLAYQWQRDGADIAGATEASFTLASPQSADSGAAFRVVVSNSLGSLASASVLLSVDEAAVAPTIVTQPQSATVLDGSPAILSVAATGTAPFSYQWRKNGVGIVGGTDSTFTTPVLALADSGAIYSVAVSNGAGTVASANATVTVGALPLVWQAQPAATSVAAGQTAQFTVTAAGSLPISYQWKRNGTDIAGATGASYTAPAATLADDGANYSVVATNPAGGLASANARLTVQAVAVAPGIATVPTSITVNAGQVAGFGVTGSGTAPLNYQWLRNGVDIAGATSVNYAIAATTAADNSARFSVRVTNTAGSVTSVEAVLTVQVATGPLDGRAWSTGQLLETDDNLVRDRVAGIDDAGHVTVVFRKSNGTRDVLYATRGKPNATGTAPTWSTPVAIDLLAGVPVSKMGTTSEDYHVVVAPAGNALAYWYHTAACTASTYATSGSCRYYYMARYTAASNAWSAPELITDAPSPTFSAAFNDQGDIALMGTSWVRSGSTGRTAALALFMRNATEATFRRQLLNAHSLGDWSLNMDGAGNLLLAAEAAQNATTDIVAFRGTVPAGLGVPQVLDARGAAATLRRSQVGIGGQQIIVWSQNNGTSTTVFAAASPTPTDAFVVTDLSINTVSSAPVITVSDEGQVYLFDLTNGTRTDWRSGVWNVAKRLPDLGFNSITDYAFNRNGDYLGTSSGGFWASDGLWVTYEAKRNAFIRAPRAYILGFKVSAGYGTPVLSTSGFGAEIMLNKFDVLPTVDVPSGDGRAVNNLWGVYLK